MPIYEYRCPNGHTFEVFQRMTDPPVAACETCGASPVEKLLFPVAVHFKGSGFYATDYGLIMSGTLLSVAPVMCLFLLLQKEFISGLTSGAVKG